MNSERMTTAILHHLPYNTVRGTIGSEKLSVYNMVRMAAILPMMDVVTGIEPTEHDVIYGVERVHPLADRARRSTVELRQAALDRLIEVNFTLNDTTQRNGNITSNSLFRYLANETSTAADTQANLQDMIGEHVPETEVKAGKVYNLMDPGEMQTTHLSVMGTNRLGTEWRHANLPQVLTIPWNNGPLAIMNIYTAQRTVPVPTRPYPRMGALPGAA